MKAYTDHCNIKMPIKITLIVFISIVFQKMLTTVLPKLRQQDRMYPILQKFLPFSTVQIKGSLKIKFQSI